MDTDLDQHSGFVTLLESNARSPEIPESADVYGWLCGSWDLDVLCYLGVNVAARGPRGEVHAARVLANSFHWRGEALYPDKSTWTLEAEFLAKRR